MIGDDKPGDPPLAMDDKEEETQEEERNWEKERAQMRRIQELRDEIDLGRGVARSPPRKRLGEEQESKRDRSKKWKYPPLEDDWGENISPQDSPAPSNSPNSPRSLRSPGQQRTKPDHS